MKQEEYEAISWERQCRLAWRLVAVVADYQAKSSDCRTPTLRYVAKRLGLTQAQIADLAEGTDAITVNVAVQVGNVVGDLPMGDWKLEINL